MICTVGQITDTDIKKIIEDPKRVELLINNGEYFEQTKKSFFQKLFSKDQVKADAWKPKLDEPQCDLDKAWHAIHFLLTGNAEGGDFPLNFLMTGGQEVGEDIGYGPIRILMIDEVRELKQNLDKIDVTTFKKKYNPADLNKSEVYPLTSDWTQEEESWIVEEYENLKKFVDEAYHDSKGLYVTIT